MPTTTTWTQGNKLPRHKHPVRSPEGVYFDSEHFASQLHRNDPEAHAREESWSHPDWTFRGNDAGSITPAERDDMLEEAKRIHDAALNNTPYTPSYAQPNVPTQALSPAGPVSPTSPGQDPPPRVTFDPAPLLKRLDDVENVALLVMDQTTKAEKLSNDALRKSAHALRVAALASDNVKVVGARLNDKLEDYDAAIAQIERRVEATRRVEYVIHNPATNITHTHVLPSRHRQFDTLVQWVTALEPQDRNIWMAGPMGSGKTTAARQLAQVLNLPYDNSPSILMGYELVGFIDAGGTYHATAFRRMYENGGVWLGDECDGSSAAATILLNGALSNSHMSFPDKQVPRHPNFIAVAAANTWGLGGDANYVGRNKLDAAFLDRFVTLNWDYDEDFERLLAGPEPLTQEWVTVVQTVRAATFSAKAQGMVISPRASLKGAQLLRANVPPPSVVQATFGRYRTHSMWPSVGKAAEDFAKRDKANALASRYNGVAKHPAVVESDRKKLQAVDFSDVKVFDRRSR